MNKSLLEVYGLSVCFVSMGCLCIFSGILLYSLVELAFPSMMNRPGMHYPPQFSSHGVVAIRPDIPPMAGRPLPALSERERIKNNDETNRRLEQEQKRNSERAVKYMRAESTMSMVRSVIILLIASIVFAFHWRIAKQARNG